MTSSPVFVWCRMERRVSLPVLSLSDQRLSAKASTKGGVFAFAPTMSSRQDGGLHIRLELHVYPIPDRKGTLRSAFVSLALHIVLCPNQVLMD
jgi:hypothetical protein